jgi:membrane protein YqaA with SNARE-associated domain
MSEPMSLQMAVAVAFVVGGGFGLMLGWALGRAHQQWMTRQSRHAKMRRDFDEMEKRVSEQMAKGRHMEL